MATIKQIGIAAATFSVALGIGFVMQNGDAVASRFGTEAAPQAPQPFTATDPISEDAMAVPDTDLTSEETAFVLEQVSTVSSQAPSFAAPEADVLAVVILPDTVKVPIQRLVPVQLASLDVETEVEVVSETAVAVESNCAPTMSATASVAATVSVSVMAPCHANTAFTVHHQGMMFSALTNETGAADLVVPALAEVTVIIAAFDDGNGAVATAVVPDFASYDRAVLQWQGETAVMLSAYEDNANFGEAGHIFVGNPGDVSRVNTAEGGYLLRLGDSSVNDALMAEVYTFPSAMMADSPSVMLIAEAEVTGGNCGKELSAQSIQVSSTGQTSALDLRMVMPECDAVGDFLILQNMFEDLTLASR